MGIKLSESENQRRLGHIQQWHTSELSMLAYSREAGLNYNNFKQWCRKWKQSGPDAVTKKTKAPGHKFIPIQMPTANKGFNKSTAPIPLESRIPIPRFELKLLFGLFHIRIG